MYIKSIASDGESKSIHPRMVRLLRGSKYEDDDAKMGRVAETTNPNVHPETMEETKNPDGKPDKTWRTQGKGLDNDHNSEGIPEMFCNADCTGRSLK